MRLLCPAARSISIIAQASERASVRESEKERDAIETQGGNGAWFFRFVRRTNKADIYRAFGGNRPLGTLKRVLGLSQLMSVVPGPVRIILGARVDACLRPVISTAAHCPRRLPKRTMDEGDP